MSENNIDTLREIIELQKRACRLFLDKYGVDHKVTQDALFTLGKLAFLYEKAKARCNYEEAFNLN